MRLRCSERSGAFGGWDPEPLEVPKRLSEEAEPRSLEPATFLPEGMEGRVSFAGYLSRAAKGASVPPSLAGGG